MKNKIIYFFLIIFFTINIVNFSNANEEFKFNITEIEILENGNLIVGTKMEKLRLKMDMKLLLKTLL